jgi:DNA mismatch repair protein MutS
VSKITKNSQPTETPLMKQYNAIKAKYPDAVLLFRVGDFYETFGEDAVKAARVLGIILTKRHNGSAGEMELAGFPHHSLDNYLPKLVRAGYRVAICDQLEDPKLAKGIVKRGVTELVTPGVSYNDKVLDNKTNNFLAALHFDKNQAGIAFLDISTGEFLVSEGNMDQIDKLLQGFKPGEVVYQKQFQKTYLENFGDRFPSFRLEDWVFTSDFASESLQKQFGTISLKGFGIDHLPLATIAAGAALHYLAETAHDKVSHITTLSRIEEEKYVWLDRFTIRNLELLYSPHENARTLIDILDHTQTPMGGRLLKRWVVLPLKEKKLIEQRLESVDSLVKNEEHLSTASQHLSGISDLERLISKVAVGRVTPREMTHLFRAMEAIRPLQEFCLSSGNKALEQLGQQFDLCEEIRARMERELDPEAPMSIGKGNVIKTGINAELDELRHLQHSGKDYLIQIQQRESERTGIPSLKVAFNNVFGYYLEVTNVHKDKVPNEWIRKQTLTNAERYITEELKEYETKILGAEEKIFALETKLFAELVFALAQFTTPIQRNSFILAQLDVFHSYAKAALKFGYTKPDINESTAIQISNGRHPVIEQSLPEGVSYVPNDIFLDNEKQQIIMITGPNMSGKSAILRQTALIVLMAQMGSFVPAQSASIGIVDKVFTRVGASDNISSGESTFMVEMNETASILNNISDRSLILLDEIGRGTSTYDGISIAWAIAEFLHENGKSRPKTLFATHYHELNDMEKSFDRIHNYNVAVKETGNKVIFLRKLTQGGSEHSFGIHVAKLAGMPVTVVHRAQEMLKQLEKSHAQEPGGIKSSSQKPQQVQEDNFQLSFFQLDDPVLSQIKEEIQRTDINSLTPVEALMKLNDIKKLIGG